MGMVGDGGVGSEAASEGSVRGRAPAGGGPRERLLRQGAQALTDPELLAVLLGTGTRGNPVLVMAETLLNVGGGLRAIAQCDPQELCEFPGLGPARAAQVLAALELGRRIQRSTDTRPRLQTPQQIFEHVLPELCALPREVFHVMSFNGRNTLLANTRVAEGTQSACMVEPREVFRAALAARAQALVFVHNHPSGDPTPSAADLALTRQLLGGAGVMGITVMDHLIVGDRRYHSMAEAGQLKTLEAEAAGWAGGGGRGSWGC